MPGFLQNERGLFLADLGVAPLPIMIDCDPGVDDAIALLLALASPELEILGITAVAGNVPMANVQRNARFICELAGHSEQKVFQGCTRPMVRGLEIAKDVHGEGGLAGVEFPEPAVPLQRQHGVDFLIETLLQATAPVTLATLGPLTNVAIALVKEPRIQPSIKELVMMGGSATFGNITASAEFNLYVDPHAAHVVFSSGLPITMFGLHVTHTVLTTPERRDRIHANGNRASQIAAKMLAFYGSEEAKRRGLPGSPLHDPCVLAYLIDRTLFRPAPAHVTVELQSPLTMGRTVVDWHPTQPPNAQVIQTADVHRFYTLLTERLATLP